MRIPQRVAPIQVEIQAVYNKHIQPRELMFKKDETKLSEPSIMNSPINIGIGGITLVQTINANMSTLPALRYKIFEYAQERAAARIKETPMRVVWQSVCQPMRAMPIKAISIPKI